jgi:transglutaminase-like putative cysteine protease
MRFRIKAALSYGVNGPCSFLFNVAALQNRFQHVTEESLTIENGEAPTEFLFNGARFHRTKSRGPELRLDYCATVALSPEVEKNLTLPVRTLAELPAEVLIYLFPSRYCQSDSLLRFARSEFWADHLTGFELVTRLCNWIYEKVAYRRGATTSITSAFDTVTEREGVCRDFAHLGIALCRALGVPARFVSTYAYGRSPRPISTPSLRLTLGIAGTCLTRAGWRPKAASCGWARDGMRPTRRSPPFLGRPDFAA